MRVSVIVLVVLGLPSLAVAAAHGPVFGLATPTNSQSVDARRGQKVGISLSIWLRRRVMGLQTCRELCDEKERIGHRWTTRFLLSPSLFLSPRDR